MSDTGESTGYEDDGVVLDWKDVESWTWKDIAKRFVKRAGMLGYSEKAIQVFCKTALLYDSLLSEAHLGRFDEDNYNFPFSDLEINKYEIYYVKGYGQDDDSINVIHTGIDLKCPVGVPIRAVADGTVVNVGNKSTTGKIFDEGNAALVMQHEIDNVGTMFSRFLYCSKFYVNPGDTVSKGDIIAETGDVSIYEIDEPHLHFELSPGDGMTQIAAVDPLTYYDKFKSVVSIGGQLKTID